jgi:hypothetical protein
LHQAVLNRRNPERASPVFTRSLGYFDPPDRWCAVCAAFQSCADVLNPLLQLAFKLLSTFPVDPTRPLPVHHSPGLPEECRREQMSQRRETRLPVQLGLPGYLTQLCGHRHPASVCAGGVALSQSRFAPPHPPVRGFPALRVLSAGPTSSVASVVLRMSIRSTYSVGIAPDQDHAGSLRFLDASVYGRAVLSDPAAVSDYLRLLR